MGPFVAQGLAALIANLAALNAGTIFGWASPSLSKLLDPDDENGLKLTPDEGSWTVSMTSLGCIFGPIMVNLFVDKIGRKWSLRAIMIPMLVSWLIIGLATGVEALYVGRFVGGLGLGAVYAVMPMYMGEIAEDRIRGALGTLMVTTMNIGMLLSFSAGPWITRGMLSVVLSVPAILFLALSPIIPETPYFLLMKGDREKAEASLVWLRRRSDVSDELSALEIIVAEQQKSHDGFSIAELFRSHGSRRAIGITVGLITFQQFSGIIAIQSYAGLIFENSGLVGWSNYSVIIMGLVSLIAGVSVIFIIDVAGRRPILMISAISTSFFLVCEAVFFHLDSLDRDTGSIAWLPLVGIIFFYLFFVPGLGSIPYAMIGELFPTNVKAPATMLISVYGSTLGFVVAKIYQVAGDAIGTHWVFYFFAATTLVGTLFIYLCVPETKRVSLQDIQENLNANLMKPTGNPTVQ